MSLLSMDGVLLIVFAAVLGLVAWALMRATAAPETQEVRRTVQCPVHDRPSEVVLVRDVRTGRLTSVARCTLRAEECQEECARLLELGAALEPREEGSARPRPR